MKLTKEFTEEYLKTFGEGMQYSGRTTLSGMLNTELPTTARIIKVPFFVIQGKEDMATPRSTAKCGSTAAHGGKPVAYR
jgi:hypothetical protein